MIEDRLVGKNIILGSGSPRRAELLTTMGLDFSIRVSDVDETVQDLIDIRKHASYLSRLKSDALLDTLHETEILVTSDTTVVIGDQILNKPENRQHAIHMISSLQGNTHEVITGLTVTSISHSITIDDVAEVSLAPMNRQEIEYYVDLNVSADKAGAYGIQDWIGLVAITKITGSYYTIMGLPTHRLYEILMNWK